MVGLRSIGRRFGEDFNKRFSPFWISAIICLILFQHGWEKYGLVLVLYIAIPFMGFVLAILISFKQDFKSNQREQGRIVGNLLLIWMASGLMWVLGMIAIFTFAQSSQSFIFQLLTSSLLVIGISFLSSGAAVRSIVKRGMRVDVSYVKVGIITAAFVFMSLFVWFAIDEMLHDSTFEREFYMRGANPFYVFIQRPIRMLGFASAAWQIVVGMMLCSTAIQEEELAKIEMIGEERGKDAK